MSKTIDFWVAGVPAPGGSKKAFYNPKIGRAIITEDNKRSKPWRALVSQAAIDASAEVLSGPLRARFEKLANKQYVFTLSDAVPGGVYAVRTRIDGESAGLAALAIPEGEAKTLGWTRRSPPVPEMNSTGSPDPLSL